MPPVTGVSETCLYVDNLAEAKRFYQDLFAWKVLRDDSRLCAFDAGGGTVLILFARGATLEPVQLPGGVVPPHDGSGPLHFALGVPFGELARWKEELAQRGIAIESEVDWPLGGRSLYLRDPGGHLLELATPGIWWPASGAESAG